MLHENADLMLVAVELMAALACLTWIAMSVARAARHIGAVMRQRSRLARKQDALRQEVETARRAARQEDNALRQMEKAVAARQAEVDALQARLADLRREGLREYQVFTERFGEKDRLWLLTVPQPGRRERWAVPAPDAASAGALLGKSVTSPERPVVDGDMV